MSTFAEETPLDDIVTIELFGEKFRFKPESQVQEAQEIAEHITRYVALAEEEVTLNPTERNKLATLLLAAMNISKDYFELKSEYSKLEKFVAQRTTALLKKIDDGLD